LQNRDSSGFSWPHAGHARMREPYDTQPEMGIFAAPIVREWLP
jgi:hypothetical protein